MNRVLLGGAFLVVLGAATMNPAKLTAQEPSQAEQEVLTTLQEYARVSMSGKVDEIMKYFHARFSAWDYAQAGPVDRAGLREMLTFYLTEYRQTAFNIEPAAIYVHGDIAILHADYDEVFTDQAGVETPIAGRWTATLLKEEGKWLFLSWAWVQTDG
ncbi:MAG: nuclear transport factor 2 family protein [Gemmatimonadota bacterium]|nr:MAG: nuclear transport factor 2 family protein [Gemmatimonadota bacterium]